jgi:hypothetical protein
VVDVEDDHLGGAPRLAAGLDRAGGRVGAAHEADRARRRVPPPFESCSFDERDAGEVDARAGAALEDDALARTS